MERNKQNFIPPSSRMTNYVVLRFGDLKPEPNASFFFCAIYVYNIVFYSMNYMS